jgi:predicted DNA-binding antitoxin AbrB/MazE fold protein
MYQAIEAICTNGTIQPLEPVVFEESEHLVILRLPRTAFQPKPRMQARGAMKGVLSSVDEFIADKTTEIALEEKP